MMAQRFLLVLLLLWMGRQWSPSSSVVVAFSISKPLLYPRLSPQTQYAHSFLSSVSILPPRCDPHLAHGTTTVLWSSQSSSTTRRTSPTSSPLVRELEDLAFGDRLITLPVVLDSPVGVEVYRNGATVLGYLDRHYLEFPHDNDESSWFVEPKVRVTLLQNEDNENDRKIVTVDWGQITTVWWDNSSSNDDSSSPSAFASSIGNRDFLSKTESQAASLRERRASALERVWDRFYQSVVRQGRGGGQQQHGPGLTKKQIPLAAADLAATAAAAHPTSSMTDDQQQQQQDHVEHVLRQLLKAGPHCTRLLDSARAAEALFATGPAADRRRGSSPAIQQQQQWAVASLLLTHDAQTGGRFKRWPTLFVERQLDKQGHSSVTLANGGWLVVDQQVRAGLEARKLVAKTIRAPSTTTTNNEKTTIVDQQKQNNSNNNDTSTKIGSTTSTTTTAAEDRILRRLECLAMGEQQQDDHDAAAADGWGHDRPERVLERDVRETLRVLQLPYTPNGAQTALVQMGQWSSSLSAANNNKKGGKKGDWKVQPWSRPVLEAAQWYVQQQQQQQQQGFADYDDRVDLSSLPCLCIDAARTTFRDDALGIRPRQGTGRPVIPGASKWEVLIHIVDLTDIYVQNHNRGTADAGYLSTLREAAQQRGSSRYDLPFGPLHLLPPTVLRTLTFSQDRKHQRCVTVWVYLDESTGRVVDSGVEQTVVSQPYLLSYRHATEIMKGQLSRGTETSFSEKRAAQLRVMLLVLEKLLGTWSDNRQRSSLAAQSREQRLSQRAREHPRRKTEMVEDGFDIYENESDATEPGFARTRGHQLVDKALDLYSVTARRLLRRAKAPIPMARGAGHAEGARSGTAPLRRYIDGECQRQLVAVFCDKGTPLSKEECITAGRLTNEARNKIARVRALRTKH